MQKVSSPVNISLLEKELASHPDREFVEFLSEGFHFGFDIGYYGPDRSKVSRNLQSARDNPEVVDAYLQDEIRKGRIMGPFDSPPFENFQCQPIGIVPKKVPGKFRTIMDLSYPEGSSVNDFINKEEFSLKYVTVDRAIEYILQLGRGCFLSKVDIEGAFRIIPICPENFRLLGILWKEKYYYDTRLSMGGRSSPALFDRLSEALEWLAARKYGVDYICHLLDDFLVAELPSKKGESLNIILELFQRLSIPIAQHKVEGPSQKLEFLGITLDTVKLEASLSDEKVHRLIGGIESFLARKKCSKRELLSLIGSLSFACKVVAPGRIFLHRLITLSCTVRKLHYKVYINQSTREDLKMWLDFLKSWNGKSFFLERELSLASDLKFFTDASSTIGYGGYFGRQWFCDRWDEDDVMPSMAARELYPIVLSAIFWGQAWGSKRIQVFCDNEGTVALINKGYSSDKIIAKMLRCLTLQCMTNNFNIRATHIPGKKNVKADLISRLQLVRFRKMFPDMDSEPIKVTAAVKNLIGL